MACPEVIPASAARGMGGRAAEGEGTVTFILYPSSAQPCWPRAALGEEGAVTGLAHSGTVSAECPRGQRPNGTYHKLQLFSHLDSKGLPTETPPRPSPHPCCTFVRSSRSPQLRWPCWPNSDVVSGSHLGKRLEGVTPKS